jgi:hypothetical protein
MENLFFIYISYTVLFPLYQLGNLYQIQAEFEIEIILLTNSTGKRFI